MRCPAVALAVLLGVALPGCGAPSPAGRVIAVSAAELDALFHADPRWLGGDGALSVPLGPDRVLWLFGDSFVSTRAEPPHDRTSSTLIRNTVAIQSGLDPRTARMTFSWRTDAKGRPAPFLADEGERWHWPAHGLRVPGGPLVLFWAAVRAAPGEGLGFREAGTRVALVDNPDDAPADWRLEARELPLPAADRTATVGIAVVVEGQDVYAFTTALGSQHRGWLARFALSDLAARRLEPRWWTGSAWATAGELGAREPATILDDIAPECSVHRDPVLGWVHLASQGFGATTVALRTAATPTGPFSAPQVIFTPPESKGPKPFVYAAKAHPELRGTGAGATRELLLTYATNGFEFKELFTEAGKRERYWPRFVRITLPPAAR